MSSVTKVLFYFLFPASIAVLFGLLSVGLGQDTNGDVWNYHWYNAWSYLNNRATYDIAPAGAHSYLNPYLDTLYYYCITHVRAKAHALLFGIIQGSIAFPVLMIVRFFIKDFRLSAMVILLCCFGSIFFIGELGQSMQDNTTALIILISLSLIIYNIKSRAFYPLLLSGFLTGAATGLKLTSATYLISFCILVALFSGENWKEKIKNTFLFGVLVLIGVFISTGYWCLSLYREFENPVFPFYNNFFGSKYALLDPNATRHMFFFQQKGLENILYPFYFANHTDRISSAANAGHFVLYTPMACFIFAPLAAVLSIKSIGVKLFVKSNIFILFVFYFSSYFIWQKAFGVYRYFIPTDLLTPLVIFVSLKSIFESYFNSALKGSIVSVVILSSLVVANFHKGIPTWGRGTMTNPYFSSNVPAEIQNADVLFTMSSPSAWIIPAINPNGHIVGLGDMLFNYGTDAYWDLYFSFVKDKNDPSQYIIYDLVRPVDLTRIENKLDRFHLKVDFEKCKEFSVNMSSFVGNQKYCPVFKK